MYHKDTVTRYFRIHPENIAFLKFILEAYEGFGQITTVDAKAAVVLINIAPDFCSDLMNYWPI